MTTTPVLSLGAALSLSISLMGCKLPFSAAVETPEKLISISDQQPEPIGAATTASPPAIAEPAPERPYMSPPLIPGYKAGDPLFSGSAPASVEPLPTGKTVGLPPVPNPAGLPVLEQQPDAPVPLIAPDSVTKSTADGLYYKAGESKPYTGRAVLWHTPGQRKFEGSFKEGYRDGYCLEWYPNGKKYYEGEFSAIGLDGKWGTKDYPSKDNGRLINGNYYWYYAEIATDSGEPNRGGTLKIKADYDNGRMVRGYHWDPDGAIYR